MGGMQSTCKVLKTPFSFQDNLFFHDTMEELHEHVDREILPEEYGGTLPKLENTQARLASLKFENYFKELKKLADDNRGRYCV